MSSKETKNRHAHAKSPSIIIFSPMPVDEAGVVLLPLESGPSRQKIKILDGKQTRMAATTKANKMTRGQIHANNHAIVSSRCSYAWQGLCLWDDNTAAGLDTVVSGPKSRRRLL